MSRVRITALGMVTLALVVGGGLSCEDARREEAAPRPVPYVAEPTRKASPPVEEVVAAKADAPVGDGAAEGRLSGKSKDSHGLGGLGLRGTGAGGGGGVVEIGMMGTKGSGYGSGMGRGSVGLASRSVSGELRTNNTEGYRNHGVNGFVSTEQDRSSTFAIDVDTASYTIARRKLLEGSLPPKDSVRVEEFLNYFRYEYPQPRSGALAVHMDAAPSPFQAGRHLLRVGVQGKRLSVVERKSAHLTFLVDVSGSMQSPDKLPLAKRALRMLVDNLKDGDTVALVTYAGGVKLALPPTGMEEKARIHAAIEDLTASGSTAMAGGLELAYKQAMRTLDGRSTSRVIVLSDGDANVGAATHQEILKLIRGYVKEGVTLSTVGFGMGNYKDELMEQLADRGNGNYFYVDSLMQARRIFQEQLGGTLEVIAQDVKLQIDFDPAQVKRYRLVGYENRDIADEDFRDDKVDAGELGAGHSVTALYEVELAEGAGAGLAVARIRAKRPRGEVAEEAAFPFRADALARSFEAASVDLRFATAVMAAAEIFRRSPHAAGWRYEQVLRIALEAAPAGNAERAELVALLEHARVLAGKLASR